MQVTSNDSTLVQWVQQQLGPSKSHFANAIRNREISIYFGALLSPGLAGLGKPGISILGSLP